GRQRNVETPIEYPYYINTALRIRRKTPAASSKPPYRKCPGVKHSDQREPFDTVALVETAISTSQIGPRGPLCQKRLEKHGARRRKAIHSLICGKSCFA